MKTGKDFLSALILMAAMAMTFMQTSCTKDDDSSVEQPVEYDKLFAYTYEGNTLYYAIDSVKQSAWVMPPLWPDYSILDDDPEQSLWLGYDQPKGDMTIPAEVEYCGKRFPVNYINSSTFRFCSVITNVTLPTGIKFISSCAFQFCFNLQSINLPEGMVELFPVAFGDCHSLKEITLPSTLKYIGDTCFAIDTLLSSITIPESVDSIGQAVFQVCRSLTEATILSKMKVLPGWSFFDCVSLRTVKLSEGLEIIGPTAFCYCEGLESINLPGTLKGIDEWAFEGCLSLRELRLPASVTEIANNVFVNGTKLDKLILDSAVPPTIQENTFDDYSAAVIVPKGAGEAYRRHEFWGRFTNITEEK